MFDRSVLGRVAFSYSEYFTQKITSTKDHINRAVTLEK